MAAVRTDAVICTYNSQFVHQSLAPYCLLAGVRKFAPERTATVREGTVNEPWEALLEAVLRESPRVLGISVYIWNLSHSLRLAEAVKERLPDCFVVMGGPEVAYCPREILEKYPFVDGVLTGEGERSFALLVDAIAEGKSPFFTAGLSYREEEGVWQNAPEIFAEDPPSPYLPEYFEGIQNKIAYLETSRGCPFRCAFCLSGREGGVRFFDLERAKREVLLLAEHGVRTVKLVDRTFNADPKRALDFFRFLADARGRGLLANTRIHFEISSDLLTEEIMDFLDDYPTGLVQFEIGLQSFSPAVLRAVRRRTDLAHLEKTVARLVARNRIHVHVDLIAGLSREDLPAFLDGVDRAYRLGAHMLQVGFLKVIPGCAMRENGEEYPMEYCKEPPYEVISTPHMTQGDLALLHLLEEGVDRFYNKGRWRRTLAYLIESTGKSPSEVFLALGGAYAKKKSEETLSDLLLQFGSGAFGVNRNTLVAHMLFDHLSKDSSGILPSCLKTSSENYRNLKKMFLKAHPIRSGIRRGVALLPDGSGFLWADYDPALRDPVTGDYPICTFSV
jgi:radical SAM superfamily enzyme YgiQ (UPF0313 family)